MSPQNLEQAAPVCVRLKNIIDLALGTPEVGVVNFNLIHSALHVITSKLKLQDVKVEVRGEDAAALRCLIETGQVSPSVQVSEYVIETEDGELKEKKSEIITVVERTEEVSKGGKGLSVATSSQYNILDKKVSSLEHKVNDVTHKNSDILKKSKDGSKSVTEMWQMMNMTSRIDACENGVAKVSSLIEDLATEVNKLSERLGNSKFELDTFTGSKKVSREYDGSKDESDDECDNEDETDSRSGGTGGFALKGSGSVMALIDELLGDMNVLKEEVKNLNENFEGFKAAEMDGGGGCGDNDEKFCEMNQAIVRIDNAFNSQMNYYQDKLTDVENEVVNMMQCMQETRSLSGQVATLEEYSTKLQAMVEDIQTISNKTNILFDEREEKVKEIELIQDELECLKHYKADKRDVEEALDEKADIKVVNRKVSIEQFSCAFKNVCESLNELYTKMTNQEITWRNALDEIMRELEKKIDTNEATAMHEELYEKIKKLHERLKILEAAKKEAEAAGSKAKYLRNVNCISCDNRVIMQKQEAGNATFKSWPQKGNAVPYVCYDMDFLKKIHKKVCTCGQEGCDGNHLSNRYCGGSHTTISTEQRIKRKGTIPNEYDIIEGQPSQATETVVKPRSPQMNDKGIMVNLAGDTGIEIINPPKKFFDCSDYIFGDVEEGKPPSKKNSPREECDGRKSSKARSTETSLSAHSVTSKKQSDRTHSIQSSRSRRNSGKAKSPSIKKSTSEQGVVESSPASKQVSEGKVSKVSGGSGSKHSSVKVSGSKVASRPPSVEKVLEESAEPEKETEPAEPLPDKEAPAEEDPAEEAPEGHTAE